MSTSFREPATAQRRSSAVAAALFVVLLAGSISWPAPALLVNRAFFDAPLDVSEVSFLGREAPRWDVVYWWIVGMALLALLHGRVGQLRDSWPRFTGDLRLFGSELSQRLRRPRALPLLVILVAGMALVALSYRFLDMAAIAASTGWRSDWLHDWVRLSNRLGGGANPPMIVLFLVVGGLALGLRDWWRLGSAMAVAGLVAGALAGLVKRAVQRARPEAWLGHDVFGWKGETSFPSGHTIGAFALMVVILVAARSRALKVTAVVVAVSVAAARVLALRHWPSDVLMSATLGTVIGLFVGGASRPAREDGPEES
jgi:membrane-associated phospholipid phosphatase